MRIKLLIIVSLFFSFCTFSRPNVPEIFFQYSFLLDDLCPSKSKNLITKQQVRFALTFPLIATDLYQKKVISFFDFLESEFPNSGFKRRELSASFILCEEFHSFSHPFVVNLFWLSKHKLENPHSDLFKVSFAETLFHELLHIWLGENFFNKRLKFIEKYKDQSHTVQSHLYLFAIQEYVFKTLRQSDFLIELNWLYTELGGDYEKAWSIVQFEGYFEFIKDLKINQKKRGP